MFLDEELKKIYEKYDMSTNKGMMNCVLEIMGACRKRTVACNPDDFANKLKQVDGSYRLFCEKCKAPFKKDAFRIYICINFLVVMNVVRMYMSRFFIGKFRVNKEGEELKVKRSK